MAFCGRDFVGYTVLMGLVVGRSVFPGCHRRTGCGRDRPYVEAVRKLERWIASEVKAKGLPALFDCAWSTISGSCGLGDSASPIRNDRFRRRPIRSTGLGRFPSCSPISRSCSSSNRAARPRCAGQSLLARVQLLETRSTSRSRSGN